MISASIPAVRRAPEMTLSELGIHEAAHALAYDSIGIPIEAVWLNRMLDDSYSHGQTMRAAAEGERIVGMPFGQLYFVFMVGVAATVHLAGFPFEQKVNRFRSDFITPVSIAVLNKVISVDEITNEILLLRRLADGFCREWLDAHREPIFGFAGTLESVLPIALQGGKRFELRDTPLQCALTSAWGPEKPAVDDTVAAANQWISTHSEVEASVPPWAERLSKLVRDRVAQQRNYRMQGRNELCLCGSGKKYKKCHGTVL
jgi:SEC-C motif